MHDASILRDLVLLVLVAIPVAILASRIRVPSLVAFLVTGLLIGPHGLGLIGESAAVSTLAEVGTVLLLFAIGLELQLSRVMKMGREILVAGGIQVVATIVVFALIAMAGGTEGNRAVFAGALVAFSSTAVILKVYAQR